MWSNALYISRMTSLQQRIRHFIVTVPVTSPWYYVIINKSTYTGVEEVMATKNEQQPTVSRTFRAAIRIGEDFYTVEETVTLPLDASDETIAQAVNTGLKIYEAQRMAAESQVRELRAQVATSPLPIQIREPDAPASDKQRSYLDYLVNELGWDQERLHAFATEHNYDLLKINKREASELIDRMKAQLDARGGDETAPAAEEAAPQQAEPVAEPEPAHQAILPVGDLATSRQVKALERLAEERAIDTSAEMAAHYGGRALTQLSIDEAGQLLTEWQQRPRTMRQARRAA